MVDIRNIALIVRRPKLENIVRVDFHAHSVHGSNDAKRTFDDIAEECKVRGIDVVVITEHDNLTEENILLDFSAKHGICFIPGIEFSLGEWGHFVAIGVNSFVQKLKEQLVSKSDILKALDNLRSGLTTKNADFYTHQEFKDLMTNNLAFLIRDSEFKDDPVRYCLEIHKVNGFVTWVHPFIGNRLRKRLDSFLMEGNPLDMEQFVVYLQKNDSKVIDLFNHLDAIEGYNGLDVGLTSYLASDLARALRKPITAGSDGHDKGQYGTAFMEIHTDKKSIKDTSSLIMAMKNCKISLGTNTM